MTKSEKKEAAINLIVPFFNAKNKPSALEIYNEFIAIITVGKYHESSQEIITDTIQFSGKPIAEYLKIYDADFSNERRALQFEAYKAMRICIEIIDLSIND